MIPSLIDRLLEESRHLPAVGPDAATIYDTTRDRLIETVDTAVETDPRLGDLCRQDRFRQLLQANHQNHARLMAAVFSLQVPEILGRVLPWVYQAYHGQGVPPQYFQVALEAWRNAVNQLIPSERSAPILATYDWIIGQHEELCRITTDPVPDAPTVAGEPLEFLRALQTRDFPKLLALTRAHVKSRSDLSDFFARMVQPAMREVGLLWQRGAISAAEEHLYTAQVLVVLAHITCSLPSVQRTKGRAIISAAPNEFHEVGAQSVAFSLESDGWTTDFTGANTPFNDLLTLARAQHPVFLGVSVTMPYHLPAVRDFISTVHQDPELAGCRVMVGGQVLETFPEVRRAIPADGFALTCQEALAVADTWWKSPPLAPAS
jgi:MerR family transcriptional regulator, light-induced transcriptional regulator